MNYIEYTSFLCDLSALVSVVIFIYGVIYVKSVRKFHIRIRGAKRFRVRAALWVLALLIGLFAMAFPKRNTEDLISVANQTKGTIRNLYNNTVINTNSSFTDELKLSYGNDFDYLKSDTYAYDDAKYTANLLDIDILTYIRNIFKFNSNDVISFVDCQINKHTGELKLVSKSNSGETIVIGGNTESGKYYTFADQPLIKDGQLDKYLNTLIKEIDIIYDTYSPAMGGGNIISDYRVTRVREVTN